MSWHVYGLLYKQDANHAEAAKCYRSALKWDPENPQILRDMAASCVFLRDYRGLHEVRRVMLTSKPNFANNWVGLAQAHQLAGNVPLALAVLDQYEATQDPTRPPSYETSELALYRARLLQQGGQTIRALKVVQDGLASGAITDSLAGKEKRAELLLRINRPGSAVEAYLELLRANPEHGGWHAGLQCGVLGLGGDALDAHAASGEAPAAARAAEGTLAAEDASRLLAVYAALAASEPKARSPRRLVLDFLPPAHPAFAPLAGAYVRGLLRRGIPSLFSDLKHLYRSPAERGLGWAGRCQWRAAVAAAGDATAEAAPSLVARERSAALGGLITSFADAVGRGERMPAAPLDAPALLSELRSAVASSKLLALPAETGANSANSEEEGVKTPAGLVTAAGLAALAAAAGDASEEGAGGEHPSVTPWAALLAARHADETGDASAAVGALEAAIAHTPTVIDLYVAKARCLKHSGSLAAAADALDYARSLDLADRYLNTKATKYQLRAGRPDVADATIGMFVRHDAKDPGAEPLGNLREMQVMWWELEAGEAHERAGNFGAALKHFGRVDAHFGDVLADELDFYHYCVRKATLRAFADCLAVQDAIRGHAHWLRALAGTARCYLALAADPEGAKGSARFGAPKAPAEGEIEEAGDAAVAASAPGGIAAQKRAQAAAMTACRVRASVAANAAQAAAAAAKAAKSGGAVEAEEAKAAAEGKKKDDDPLGDKLLAQLLAPAAGASPAAAALEAAHRAARQLTANLPAGLATPADALAATAGLEVFAPRQATPTGGSAVRGRTSSRTKRSRGWNIGPDFAVAAHALAVDVQLARGKLAQAASHLAAARAAAGASTGLCLAELACAAPAGKAAAGAFPGERELKHPAVAKAAVRLARAAAAAPAASPTAPALAAALASLGVQAGCVDSLVSALSGASGSPPLSLTHAAAGAQLALEGAGLPLVSEGESPAISLAQCAAPAAAPALASLAARPPGAYALPPTLLEAEGAFGLLSRAAAAGAEGAAAAAAAFASPLATEAFPRADAFVMVPSAVLAGGEPISPAPIGAVSPSVAPVKA